jgi:hypothetical protein
MPLLTYALVIGIAYCMHLNRSRYSLQEQVVGIWELARRLLNFKWSGLLSPVTALRERSNRGYNNSEPV